VWIGGGQPAGPTVARTASGVALRMRVEGRRSLPQF